MDVLTDALAALRTNRPESSLVQVSAPWGLRFSPVKGAGFHVVLQGSCWLLPPDGDPIALGPGDVVFLHEGRGHGLADSPTASLDDFRPDSFAPPDPGGADAGVTRLLCGAYGLDQSRPHPLLRDLPSVVHLPARVGRHPSLRATIDLLGSELERPRPGSDAVVPALVDVLLLYILRSWYDERDAEHRRTGWAGAFTDPGISAALDAIHADPRHPWTLEALAGRAGMSRAVFARRFNSLVGEPPLTYLTQWRMRLAARLLRETKLSLAAVGEQVGYTSAFAFAKAFKRELGTAPGTYRAQNR